MPDVKRWPTSRLLYTAARLVEQGLNEKLRNLGLTYPSVIALDALAATGPITQAGLADVIYVRAQTLGPTLQKLESQGHIDRRPGNRNSHYVSITDAGKRLLHEARALELEVLAKFDVNPDGLRDELENIVLKAPKGH
ncbi:MarR family transcriptional regulator (plasmid) [Paenarthrobacter sp. OM7]|uniref:MarR family winged helix-turn-helix transcriptional regulator n=1 Tax=Paenarthrobacter sp. OM7 TaxID=3041264 RepID=UPI0024685C86|nr:MarR family transcriptional regulator [Paenarthrobacter sp. OM7]WGM22861.1 MarR family transcriptional regulator [Paenarthrobacter sp. OM7]